MTVTANVHVLPDTEFRILALPLSISIAIEDPDGGSRAVLLFLPENAALIVKKLRDAADIIECEAPTQ